jgi:hypothetical protein
MRLSFCSWNCTANDGACFVTDPWQPSVKNNTQGTIAFGAVYESVDKFCADINPDVRGTTRIAYHIMLLGCRPGLAWPCGSSSDNCLVLHVACRRICAELGSTRTRSRPFVCY